MINYVSTSNHPESNLTGSTIENMINLAQKQGLKYFAITDHGYMPSVLRGYMYAKKHEMKIIPGIEIFFKDFDCPLSQNTPSERIKYFKLVLHALDQTAYQKIVLMCSDDSKKSIVIKGNKYHLWNWSDLTEIAPFNVTVSSSDAEDMVTKHLITNQAAVGVKYYEKLKELFGNKFYPAIVPYERTEYWESVVHVTLSGNKIITIPTTDRIETDESDRAKPIELTYGKRRHNKLLYVYVNNIRYPVKPDNQDIIKAVSNNTFQKLPEDIQTKSNKFLIALAQKFGDIERLLINNNSYYAEKEDKIVQDMRLGDDDRLAQAQFMRTAEDSRAYIEGLGLDIEKLIANTHTWSELFKDFELKYDYRLPEAPEHPERYMIEVIQKNGRMKWDNPIYVQRFRDEYEVIVNNGVLNLVPYFLPLMEIHDFYKENGYLCGPARGSSAGSLIVYLLGITHIDPIKYGLSFARFLTLDRIQQSNWPDIDCDYENRDPLVGSDGYSGFLYNKYGNKAAQCSTRTLLRIKSSILDVNRFINGGTIEDDIAKLSKSLPATPQGVSDYDFIFGYEDADGHLVQGLLEQNEDLQKYALDRPKEWEIVKRALSIARQYSRHACSYLISDKPIEESVPIFEVGGVKRVTQVEHKQCEFAGLIKYDFLCVSALRDISLCMKFINIKSNAKPPAEHFIHDSKETFIWDLPENKEVFEMLGKGETETIFQLNTMTVTPYVKRIKPQNIMDLSTITSLCRPGPLDFKDEKTGNNMMEEYINRRFGHSKSDIPILDKLLPETYSVITFQEQVSRIAQELGGLSVIDAENVRIAMGKKKIKLLNSLKPKFIEGATPKIGSETAETIWSMMATFARYGFNCIAGDQLIKTNLGPVKLSKIVEKYFDYKVAYKDSCGNMQYEYPDFACSKGIKTVLTVKLSDGSILEATEDHKFLSNGEWQTLKEIIEKDLEFDCQQ